MVMVESANSPSMENQRLTSSTGDIPNSGRNRNHTTPMVSSDSEDTISNTGCPGRFSVWRMRCNARISKEHLRRQLRRSKTHVEGHVCYPWLRRLFFHLSHYFPNLHTTRGTVQRTKLRGASAGTSTVGGAGGGVQIASKNVSKTQQQCHPNDKRSDHVKSTGRPSIIVVQTNRITNNHSPFASSPQLSTKSEIEAHHANLSPTPHRTEPIGASSNRKRRPLQRQKISDTLDFDQFFTKSDLSPVDNKFSTPVASACMTQNNRENNQNDLIGYSSAECQPALFRRRSPRDPLLNSPARESVSQWSNSGQEEPLFSTTKTKSRSGKSPSRPAPTSPRPSVRRVPGVSALHLQNSDSLASSSLEPSILRSDVPDLYENDTGSPVDSRFGPARWNPQSRVLLTQTTRSSGTRTQQPENRSLIQYRRVKARRNSSSSQMENFPAAAQFQSRSSKDESSNCIREQDDPRSPTFPPLDTGPVEQRGTVKKHVETWLEATANMTRQTQTRRRGNIYHICSGDANYEPPPAQLLQPRSFDSPVPMGMFDLQSAYSVTASPRRAIQRQLQCCSQQSSDSPQLILPSMTVDARDGFSPYRIGKSLEQPDSRMKGDCGGDLLFSPHVQEENYDNEYRRYSENPIGHLRQTPQTSMSIESATGIIRADSQTRKRGSPLGQEIPKPGKAIIGLTSASVAGAPVTEGFLKAPNSSRERASSFQETGPSQRSKFPFINEVGTIQNQPRYTTERANLMKMAIIKQSRSFSSPRREGQSSTHPCFREDSEARQYPPGLVHTPNNLIPRKAPNSLQPSRQPPGTLTTLSCPYFPNCRPHFSRSRDSQFSTGITRHQSSEAGENFLKNPISSTSFERKYSHHLKPLDAWNSRQSHSMELVNTSHQTGRGLLSVGKQPLTSKLSLQKQTPQMYSRSMQQSTCSFPVQWCGFLSGPELSLTSPFDSNSITPDSQKIRHFFEHSFDGVEREINAANRILDHSPHVHSASGSPGYPHMRNVRLDRYMRVSHDSREQYIRSNLLCSPRTLERNRDRRVNSFELNLDGVRAPESKPQSYLMLPNHYSSDSSRRGSALSNVSIRSAREFAPKIDECFDDVPIATEPTVPSTATYTGKLIPPDLIFSPASRRASIMDDQERISPDSVLPPMILNKKSSFNDEGEMAVMSDQSAYCDLPTEENGTTGSPYPVEWKLGKTGQSPIHDPVIQLPTYREFSFESNLPSPRKHKPPHKGYLPRENKANVNGVRLAREQKTYDYQLVEGPATEPFCTPLSHSHDDLRRSRSHFAATSATTYPTSSSRPRIGDSRAYQALARSLAPLATETDSRIRTNSGTTTLCSPRGRRLLGGSENRSLMSSRDLSGDSAAVMEAIKRSPKRRELNPTVSDSGGSMKPRTHGTKRSVRGVRSDPVTGETTTPHLNLDKCVRENYLFRSTSAGGSNVDPRILEPSLCPVLDSSEENITDETCDEEAVSKNRRTPVQVKPTGRESPVEVSEATTTGMKSRLPASEHQAARRRSFLARYWQQAIQRSGEDSLDGVDTLRSETDG